MNEEHTEKSAWQQFKAFLSEKFNLEEDKAEQEEVVENVKRGVEFSGPNLWILMFATVIASVGLNVNSTAVIIGAMLISPLMGPIIGIGLALGINDFDLFKRSVKNFSFAIAASLAVSTLYFLISPSLSTQSELLARTTPTVWDVLIATFGGLAGIVAQSRRDRTSTVIPGVAIATALMPPLCTAGFGLATGNFTYFFGAFYLFTINAVFIALATFFIVRFMKYEKKQFLDPGREKRVKQSMIVIITATIIPSVIIAYSVVQEAMFENNAHNYVEKVLKFEGAEVLRSNVKFDRHGSKIEVMLIGENVPQENIDLARNQMENFGLDNTELIVRQASMGDHVDVAELENVLISNAESLSEKNERIARLEKQLAAFRNNTVPAADIAREMAALWVNIRSVTLSKSYVVNMKGENIDSILICLVGVEQKKKLSKDESEKLGKWLSERTAVPKVKVITE